MKCQPSAVNFFSSSCDQKWSSSGDLERVSAGGRRLPTLGTVLASHNLNSK